MYIKHFRLSEPPFSLTPDPRYFFMSERHREGLAHLLYGVQQPGGFVLLTGEVGSGKTTLCRCLIKQLPPDTEIALILNPRLTAVELLAAICDELRAPYPPETQSVKTYIDALNQRLLENHGQRKRTALVIDEAQNLSGEVLEQIRLLTNLETSQEKLLQIILIGQPELLALLKHKGLRQLAQRITARYHLLPLSRSETSAYIRHRLLIAGRSDTIFTRQAMQRVYRLSAGVPRLINMICDRALLGAYASDRRDIGAKIVGRAWRETQGNAQYRLRLALTAGIVLLVGLTAGIAIFLSNSRWKLPVAAKSSVSAEKEIAGGPPTDPKEERDPVPASLKKESPPGQKNAGAGVPPLMPGKTTNPEVHSSPSLTPKDSHLLEILMDPSGRTTAVSSFENLYARWGAKLSLHPSDLGCKVGGEQGFDCLFLSGNWSKLRRFDIPAILEMALPNGQRKRVALVGLGASAAKLMIGEREYTFPLTEIESFWSGAFILVWKPPFPFRELSLGARGKEVAWVRQALDTIEGKAAGDAEADLYDTELRQRVVNFQKSHSLIQDGSVGAETLVHLTLALHGPTAPSLSHGIP
jgi:general secretion pathway protein A